MLLIFLPVFTTATALAIYRAYQALSQSTTAVAPQELMRFLTFGGIVNKRLRALSLLFHVAIITSLFGHFFMFIKEVPPSFQSWEPPRASRLQPPWLCWLPGGSPKKTASISSYQRCFS